MVAAFTYYKKCICSEGTSTTYAPGCPVHDPRMKTAFECSDCKRLEAECQRLEANLDALLAGLGVREIDDLKTKNPEHFSKIAECIADDSQEKAAKIFHREAENKRLIDIAGDALGFSAYQRDQDTVEVLAQAFKKQSENYAELVGERDTLRARCERLKVALKRIADWPEGAQSSIAKQALEVQNG